MAKKLIQKSIRFPAPVVEILEREAADVYGISFNDYIKHMAISKVEEAKQMYFSNPADMQKPSKSLQKIIDRTTKEVAEGKIKPLRTKQDIHDYMDSI